MKKYLIETEKAFEGLGKKPRKEFVQKYQRYFKTPTRYSFYEISKARYRGLLKTLSFSDKAHSEQKKIWSYIFKETKYLDLGDLAIYYFKSLYKKSKTKQEDWGLLKTWVPYVDNWIHGDMLASLYVGCYQQDPQKVFPLLQKWSEHKKPWQRRMGLLSPLYYFKNNAQKPRFTDLSKMILKNLDHDHYYVQKAVGWTLREMTSAYPSQIWSFQKKINLKLSPIAFTTSVERLNAEKKNSLKEERKKYRTCVS